MTSQIEIFESLTTLKIAKGKVLATAVFKDGHSLSFAEHLVRSRAGGGRVGTGTLHNLSLCISTAIDPSLV